MPNTRVPAIQQRLRADAESICFKCFHRKVCRAIDNQPCIECNQFTDANDVTVQEWISVKDRLPEPFVDVIAFSGGHEMNIDCVDNRGRWYSSYMDREDATHWMPLPQPPKGE